MRALGWAWCALLAASAAARELDPAACALRFNVQHDKIIRTEESRAMGARYLSELDVGARRECLRLCCETDSCDVFVYEEKGPGSCYLFNCGPPEDFRCKFTAHTNFSSGVLVLSRHLAELQDEEQHEHALARLRSAPSSTPRARTSSATSARPASAASTAPPRPPEGARAGACSRYQFACARGGECVAVYNACDGVPQCADGSDEAPELGCPPPRAGTRAPPAQEGAEERGAADGAAPVLAERWPHRLAQAQPHRYPDGAVSSHIFSHKGGLLQEPEGGALPAQYAPFEPAWPRRAWPPPAGAEGAASERAWGESSRARDWAEPDPRRAWPVPPPPDQELPAYAAPNTMPETPPQYSMPQQALRDAPKKGLELGGAGVEPRTTVPPAPRPHADDTPAKDKATERAAPAAAHRHYAVSELEAHDGLSEHPPAAVLLLVLGVLMSAALGGMLACRARAARRRLRRGKSPFAHDADYLVNGMYL